MNKQFTIFRPLLLILITSFIFSCKSLPKEETIISRKILGQGQLSAKELSKYFLSQNPQYNKKEIEKLAKLYIEEANFEGINSDVAFAQMCLETGYLRFGNLVTPDMHNYCGLGAIDANNPGEVFENPQLGVRAHIQHLQAYATKEDVKLKGELIDPRYNWVHKTKYIEDIFGLAGNWATDKEYGTKLDTILCRMEESLY